MLNSRPCLNLLLAGLAFLTVTWVSAQSEPAKTPASKEIEAETSAAKRSPSPDKLIITPERQAAALKFAELHHPELYQLVNGLKRARRAEYHKAVRQLYNDSERLARLKERLPSRYELALSEWQLDSRLRLLVARMTMSAGDPELEGQLRELLKKRLDVRMELLKLDRERQAARLEKLEEQIEEIEFDEEAAIEKDLLRIQRSLGIPKRAPKRPATAPNKSLPAETSALQKRN